MSPNNVYYHQKMAVDLLLGRVDETGKVFETRLGPDRYIGRVDLETGRVYTAQLGPDKVIGYVEPNTGKVFAARFGPDEYLGQVMQDGRLYYALPLTRDPYLGQISEMSSRLHGGAAYLLLVLPYLEVDDTQ